MVVLPNKLTLDLIKGFPEGFREILNWLTHLNKLRKQVTYFRPLSNKIFSENSKIPPDLFYLYMNTKQSFLCFLLLFVTSSSFSQGWQMLIGGSNQQTAFDAIQTADGGYLICGDSWDYSAGSSDIYVVKLDGTGNLLWGKTYGTTAIESGKSISPTSDGGFVISGISDYSPILLKIDAAGNMAWCKYSGTFNMEGRDVVPLGNEFAVTGGASAVGASLDDIGLVKFSASGDILTQIRIDLPSVTTSIPKATVPTFGGVAVIGTTANPNQSDIFIIESNFGPNCAFSKVYQSPGGEAANDLLRTADSGFVIAGRTTSYGAGNSDAYILRVDGGGNIIWAKTYGSPAYEAAEAITQTADGGFAFTALIENHTASLVKVDATGNLIWASTYRLNNCRFFKVIATNDGGLLAVGTANEAGSNNGDFFIVKTNANGISGCVQSVPPLTVGNATPNVGVISSIVYPVSPATYDRNPQLGNGGSFTDPCIVQIAPIQEELSIIAYANPASSELHINLPKSFKSVNVRIFDMMGREMMSQLYSAQEANGFPISHLPPGQYLLSMVTPQGERHTIFQKQ